MPMQDESMSLLYLPSGEWPEKNPSFSSPPLLWSGIYNANGLLSERMEQWGDFYHAI